MSIKRSEIDSVIDQALIYFQSRKIPLPSFAFWTSQDWLKQKNTPEEIKKAHLGWDVTDFGLGNFSSFGRVIFTLRNGFIHNGEFTKPYAQKIMYMSEGQKSPIHYHQSKTEDIVNWGEGNIVVRLWPKSKQGTLAKNNVSIFLNWENREIGAGEKIILKPGDSICIKPHTFHQFWCQENTKHTISMEISSVNNDLNDNFWLEEIQRYPTIIEDQPKKYLLCYEY